MSDVLAAWSRYESDEMSLGEGVLRCESKAPLRDIDNGAIQTQILQVLRCGNHDPELNADRYHRTIMCPLLQDALPDSLRK